MARKREREEKHRRSCIVGELAPKSKPHRRCACFLLLKWRHISKNNAAIAIAMSTTASMLAVLAEIPTIEMAMAMRSSNRILNGG